MKKLVLVAVVIGIGSIILMSFTNKEKILTNYENSKIVEQSSNCVRIYVKWPSGNKATNGTVSGAVCSGGTTKRFYLNNSGYADICYSSDSSLCTIYIDGKGYDVDYYKKGKSYTIYKR